MEEQPSIIFRKIKEDEVMICSCDSVVNQYNERKNEKKKHLFFPMRSNVLGKIYDDRKIIMDDISIKQKIFNTNDLNCAYYQVKIVKEQEGVLPFDFFIDQEHSTIIYMNELWYISSEIEIILFKGDKKIKKQADNDKIRLYIIYDIDEEGIIEIINVKSNVSKSYPYSPIKNNRDVGFRSFVITKKHVIDQETNDYNRHVNSRLKRDLNHLVDKISWDAMLRGMIRKGKKEWSAQIDFGYGTVTLSMKSNIGKIDVVEELN